MKKYFSATAFLLLFLSHVIVAHDVCVGSRQPHTQIYTGPTFCTDVTIHNLTVDGPLTVSGSRLYGDTTVSGPVTASYTCADRIFIKNNTSQNNVTISNNSIVKGNLVFEGAHGTYSLDSTSVIYGNIINGSPSQIR